MADIFISYANQDRAFAAQLAEALETRGWSVWWDRKIPPGKSFETVIGEAIDAASCVVVVWSKASVASDWVKDEAVEGKDRGILIPIAIDSVRAPFGFRQVQAADMIDWQGETTHDSFQALIRAMSDLTGAPAVSKQPPSPSPARPRTKQRKHTGRSVARSKPTAPATQNTPAMVVVSAATFRTAWATWDESEEDSPNTVVEVAKFSIARSPVTQAEIAQFLATAGRLPARLERYWNGNQPTEETRDRPAVWITWKVAAAYAEWLGRKTGRKFRLPNEHEWERAATSSDIEISPRIREWTASTEEGQFYRDLGEESPIYHVVRSRKADGKLIRAAIVGAPKASIGFRLAADCSEPGGSPARLNKAAHEKRRHG